jgi:hypothetical protein
MVPTTDGDGATVGAAGVGTTVGKRAAAVLRSRSINGGGTFYFSFIYSLVDRTRLTTLGIYRKHANN